MGVTEGADFKLGHYPDFMVSYCLLHNADSSWYCKRRFGGEPMKFKVTMKDPDSVGDAISDAVTVDLNKIEGLDRDDRDALFDTRQAAAQKVASKWFRYGEYLTVEIDTDAGTATVLPAQ